MRLEPELWAALDDICGELDTDLNAVCSEIAGTRQSGGLTSAVRSYVVGYLRSELRRLRRGL